MNTVLLSLAEDYAFDLSERRSPFRTLPDSVATALGTSHPNDLVAWAVEGPSIFGVARGPRFLAIRKKKVRELVICHELPAKGSGSVSLEVVPFGPSRFISLIESHGFSQDKLEWLLDKQTILERLFGLAVRRADSSYDC